ncbi:unnamed protein product [Peronospora farinosa]|uniref:BAG domain-containing protein n=1 Tax=Peronospora farinosa TaxID=134698 RepID=A0AAV0TVF4_9STRA|nr:unnamed protein product [Peronospora farinosa]
MNAMDTQTSQEKSRLQTIKQNINDVQEKLSTRLPAQYRHLMATVCGTKWRLKTFKPHDAAAIVKKMRLELGAFDYRVKEQEELLTRYLLELDGILSHGDADIKSARKALVVFIQQQLLPQADAFKERSAKLKQFGEKALGTFEQQTLEPLMPRDSDAESDDMHVKALFNESGEEGSESEDGEESSESEEEKEEAAEDEEMGESTNIKDDEPMESEAEADKEDEEEEEEQVDPKLSRLQSVATPSTLNGDVNLLKEDEPMVSEAVADDEDEYEEEEQVAPMKSRLQAVATPPTSNVDVNLLPVWRPYYQLQRRQDGIYLIARLNDIDPRNVRVQWNDHNGVLRVSGFRLPMQKDIVMSRLSGAPTFGRFEITEQFPRNMLNMEEATQQISENGILQIRMPYYVVRRPLQYRRASLFQPQDCFVW